MKSSGFPNHEHMIGGFSTIYMSEKQAKKQDEPSFTIQAGGRHAPLHPDSAKMIKKGADDWKFSGPDYRARAQMCKRVQSFPDNFIFYSTIFTKGITNL